MPTPIVVASFISSTWLIVVVSFIGSTWEFARWVPSNEEETPGSLPGSGCWVLGAGCRLMKGRFHLGVC